MYTFLRNLHKILVMGILLVMGMAGCARMSKETPLFLTQLYSKTESAAGTSYGTVVVSGADVNGDGKNDFVVSAPYANSGGLTQTGSIYVYSGANGNLLWQKDGPSANYFLGTSLALGDLNGDRYIEVMVGATPGGTNGLVRVYSGSSEALLFQIDATTETHQLQFGTAIAYLGDINGDQKGDLVIGAPDANPEGASLEGSVFVHSGVEGSLLKRINGSAAWDRFGFSLASTGDIDGDGKNDFMVGAPFANAESKRDAGSVYLYSGANGNLRRQINGSLAGERFGSSLASADIDGDGKNDFIIAAPHASPGEITLAGSVYVYSGSDGSLLLRKDGAAMDDRFGTKVASAGDVNADGKGDFLVGVPNASSGGGTLYVFSGADGSLLYQKNGSATEALGTSLAYAGDLNGDGKVEIVVGGQGEVKVYSFP